MLGLCQRQQFPHQARNYDASWSLKMAETNLNIDSFIGHRVQITLSNQAYSLLDGLGITSPKFYANILGYDSIGIWVENPHYCITPAYDAEGNYIPPEKRKEECHRAALLILWSYIVSIVAFPDVEEFMPEEPEHVIGFSAVREKERELGELKARAEQRAKKTKQAR